MDTEISIFQVVPENFFSILASQNKKIYLKIISLIYRLVQNGLSYGIDKEILIDEIESYMSDEQVDLISDNGDDEEVKNNRERANIIIRRLIDTGWIYPENTADYKVIINFNDYAITILESFIKVANKEALEYRGNIISIYTLLYSSEKSGIVIKQVLEYTRSIMSGLKTLNANIKRYMDNLTKMKSPQEILDEFFGNYTKEIIDKAYHKLKTSENVSKYRPKIIQKLRDDLEDVNFIEETSSFFLEDNDDINSKEESILYVKDIINNVMAAFEQIDDIMGEIDRKNSKYIKAAVTRAKFLLNNTNDVTGNIKRILQYVNNQYKELELNLSKDYLEDITDLFTLYSYNYIDENSLYTANEGKKTFKPEKMQKNTISDEEKQRKIAEFKRKQEKQYSIKRVNDIVKDLLKDNDSISTKQLEITTIEEFIKIIYIRVYSGNALAKYYIKRRTSVHDAGDFTFNDFEIWRKK